MPAVRVERLPVQTMGLGVLGFDHLQIVFRSHGQPPGSPQDDWFVIEGLRVPDPSGVHLAVEGWDGGTTLSEANGGRRGLELARRIGTPDSRPAREIADGPEAVELWATLVSYAADIEAQKFPYVPFALPGSPLPTLNSSSLVASLLHHAGVHVDAAMPASLRFSPGSATLLGTSRDDELRATDRFTTLAAGDGNDRLMGRDDPRSLDKLYGGRGDDVFYWSHGTNIIHGGQPALDYADDGNDTLDYFGANNVRIEAPPAGAPHLVPDFIVTRPGGEDRLYSIEEIVWDGLSDRVVIGKGVGLGSAPLKIDLRGEDATGRGDVLDLSEAAIGFEIAAQTPGTLHVNARDTPVSQGPALFVNGADWIIGTAHGDRMILADGLRGVEGGAGDDLFMLASEAPLDVSGGPGADRFVIANPEAAVFIADPAPEDRLEIAWSPTDLAVAYDPEQPQDLVVRVFSGDGIESHAEVRLQGFATGDLGLDLEREIVLVQGRDGLMLTTPPLAPEPEQELEPKPDQRDDAPPPVFPPRDPLVDILEMSLLLGFDDCFDLACVGIPTSGAGDLTDAFG